MASSDGRRLSRKRRRTARPVRPVVHKAEPAIEPAPEVSPYLGGLEAPFHEASLEESGRNLMRGAFAEAAAREDYLSSLSGRERRAVRRQDRRRRRGGGPGVGVGVLFPLDGSGDE